MIKYINNDKFEIKKKFWNFFYPIKFLYTNSLKNFFTFIKKNINYKNKKKKERKKLKIYSSNEIFYLFFFC
jgi:hypothetical protein